MRQEWGAMLFRLLPVVWGFGIIRDTRTLEYWASLEEQAISLTVQALQERLILGACK